MTRPHQHDLAETAQDVRDVSTAGSIVRRAVSTANRIPRVTEFPRDPDHATGQAPVSNRAAGAISAVSGALGVGEGITGFRAAADREREARAHGDERGVQYAHEDEINSVFTGMRGAATLANGVGTFRGSPNASQFSRGAGGLQVLQGAHNGVQAYRNWNSDPERSSREASDAILNTTAGVLSMHGGPVTGAAAAGIGLGNALRDGADNHARESPQLFGAGRASERGFHPGQQRAPEGMTATDAAVDFGIRTNEHLGGGVGGFLGGLGATVVAAPFAVGASLIHGAIEAGGRPGTANGRDLPHRAIAAAARHADHVDMSDIAAQQAEDQGAPLAANDHSAVAAHRRRIQHRHAQRATAQAQAGQQLRQQIARDGHVDMMAPERAPAGAQFTPINGANAQSIERRALGLPPSREEMDAEMMRAIQ